MRGGRDRQELGQPLHDTEHDCLPDGHAPPPGPPVPGLAPPETTCGAAAEESSSSTACARLMCRLPTMPRRHHSMAPQTVTGSQSRTWSRTAYERARPRLTPSAPVTASNTPA